MDIEAASNNQSRRWDSSWRVLTLAYQSLGVVYGDLSTSPLYVYKTAFADDINHVESTEEIYGVLSCIFWTLTLIPLLKYVFIVHKADDDGEGGTFALYSLLCRHTRVCSLPNGQPADMELSAYRNEKRVVKSVLQSTLEKHMGLRRLLLILALIGARMVIGDGPHACYFCLCRSVWTRVLNCKTTSSIYRSPNCLHYIGVLVRLAALRDTGWSADTRRHLSMQHRVIYSALIDQGPWEATQVLFQVVSWMRRRSGVPLGYYMRII